jgi:hypothetical protein
VLVLAAWSPLSRWLQADVAKATACCVAQAVPGMRAGRTDPHEPDEPQAVAAIAETPAAAATTDARPPSPPIASPCAATHPCRWQSRGIGSCADLGPPATGEPAFAQAGANNVVAEASSEPICCRN